MSPEDIYNSLVGSSDASFSKGYHDPIVNEIIPNAIKQWGEGRVMGALNSGDWRRNYALNILRSTLGVGPAVYNRSGDGSVARQVYVPWSGFKMQGPGSLSGTRGEEGGPYGRFDPQGRYLGFNSGLINGSYIY